MMGEEEGCLWRRKIKPPNSNKYDMWNYGCLRSVRLETTNKLKGNGIGCWCSSLFPTVTLNLLGFFSFRVDEGIMKVVRLNDVVNKVQSIFFCLERFTLFPLSFYWTIYSDLNFFRISSILKSRFGFVLFPAKCGSRLWINYFLLIKSYVKMG